MGRRFDPDRAHEDSTPFGDASPPLIWDNLASMYEIKLSMPVKALSVIGIATTLVITPWFAFDPINLPKMLVLSTGAAFLASWMILTIRKMDSRFFSLISISLIFLGTLVGSFLTNTSPWYQQLWGTWGRSTGLLTYVSFIVMMLVAHLVASPQSLSFIRMTFERLGYAVTAYTFMQLLDLDPINWSQKAMVATLGNINFMSSFLGLTAISYASRLILERQSVSSKVYYFLFTAVNIYLILISQSIQGLGVFLAGISLLCAFFVRRKFNFVKSLALLVFTFAFGFLALAGTAGLGPLSRFSQVTVLFRIDYWRAGINMVISNPLNGVGLDSYGDFYREYRTLEATTRTGPQRVTNTAHNIFLDVFAGSGLLSGILMSLIMIITASGLLRNLKANNPSIDLPAFGGMWIGFMVFCFISINQIGVGVWGFIFTGLLNGFFTRAKIEQKMEVSVKKRIIPIQNRTKVLVNSNSKLRFRENRILRASVTAIVTLGIFILALLPNIADARFLNSVKKSNLPLAIEVIDDFGIQDFHRENLIERLKNEGLDDESLEQALVLTRINPQNWSGWVQVITNPRSSREQQLEAARNIRRIDPFNYEAQAEIEKALSP